jgi:hypothetical protein
MQGKDKAMTYKHDSKAYLIVIKASRVHEVAMNLYHIASRGEPAGYDMSQLQQAMQEVGKAFDDWAMDEGDE